MSFLDIKKTPLAVAIYSGIIYIVCRLGIALAPDFSRQLTKWWFHGVSIDQIWGPTSLSIADFIYGLIATLIAVYLAALVFVWVYQAIVKK